MRALERRQCFTKNSHCDLDLNTRTLKLKLFQDIIMLNTCMIQDINMLNTCMIQDIIMLNTCMKLQENWSINKGTRAMTMF